MNSLHTRHTCQRAIAALISTAAVTVSVGVTKILADFSARFPDPQTGLETTVAVGVHISCGDLAPDGTLPAEWTGLKLPAIVINSVHSEPHHVGYEICDVTVFAMTTIEETTAPAAVDARAGWLEALFDEDHLDTIAAALSAPASGPDNRTVKEIAVIGLERTGTAHNQRDNYVLSGLQLRIHCVATG